MNWGIISLGDVCEVTSSKRVMSQNRTNSGIPFYCSKEIILLTKRERVADSEYISEELYNAIVSKFGGISPEDILLTTRGTLGVPYLVKENDKFYFGDGNLTWLRHFHPQVNSRYIYYYLLLKYSQNFYNSAATTIPFLTINYIKQIKLPLPSRDDQDKIVCILSIYDNLIELNQRKIEILEEMAMRIYREWFVYFRFPGHESCVFENGLPKGWNLKSIGEVISFDRGCSYTSEEIDTDEGVNLVNLKNMKSYGGYNYNGLKKYAGRYNQSHIVNKGDLIMGVTDMTQDRRTVGSVALVPRYSAVSVISTDLVKVNSELPNIFLYAMFRFGGYSKHLSEFANGSNVLHLKPSAIRKELILIPTKEVIELFDTQISPLAEEMEILTRQIDRLIEMRYRLLPQLMSGLLDI